VVAKSPSVRSEKKKTEGGKEREKEIAPHYIVIHVVFRRYIGQNKRRENDPYFAFPAPTRNSIQLPLWFRNLRTRNWASLLR